MAANSADESSTPLGAARIFALLARGLGAPVPKELVYHSPRPGVTGSHDLVYLRQRRFARHYRDTAVFEERHHLRPWLNAGGLPQSGWKYC